MEEKVKEIGTLTPSMAVLPISTLAKTLGVHQRTLRIYDKTGILTPQRSEKNRRNYSLDDIQKAEFILFLTRNLALNLAGVKIILAILQEYNVHPSEYKKYINKFAALANIDKEVQEENLIKTAKKGKRTSKKDNL